MNAESLLKEEEKLSANIRLFCIVGRQRAFLSRGALQEVNPLSARLSGRLFNTFPCLIKPAVNLPHLQSV